MAAVYKIASISLILLAIAVTYQSALNYINGYKDTEECYPTLQKRVLEIIHPYIYGLSCGMEDEFTDKGGILGWILRWFWKVWKYFTMGSQEEYYVCELDWLVINIRFSVNANQCILQNIDDDLQAKDTGNISLFFRYCAYGVIGIYQIFAMIYVYFYCAGKENHFVFDRGFNTTPKDQGMAMVRPKKVFSYRLIQSAFNRRPATRGIADALPFHQEGTEVSDESGMAVDSSLGVFHRCSIDSSIV